ncbi:MAG: hypothetical protein V4534_03730 [Myxococcota bacterium]
MTWWYKQRDRLLSEANETPLYVYSQSTLQAAADDLKRLKAITQVFFALKANDHADILREFEALNLGFECVSQAELERVFELFPRLDAARVLFTPNFAPAAEYAYAFERHCHVTLDSLYPFVHWADLIRGQAVFLRIDPGQGRGHHQHVRTAGAGSKFGIGLNEVDQALALAKKGDVRIVGLHAHAGSGISDPGHWGQMAQMLVEVARRMPDVSVINLGGGLGLDIDCEHLNDALKPVCMANPQYQYWLEPGRYLVAGAGVLLTRVTQIKEKAGVLFIGVDTGMNSLIRPALYGAYHEIVNLSKLDRPNEITAHVVGPICESADFLGYDRLLPRTEAGDVLLITQAGAYGRTMASHYNRRAPAGEYFLKAC